MLIRVNGTDQDVPDACTVADLLREIGLFGRPVAAGCAVLRYGVFRCSRLAAGDLHLQ